MTPCMFKLLWAAVGTPAAPAPYFVSKQNVAGGVTELVAVWCIGVTVTVCGGGGEVQFVGLRVPHTSSAGGSGSPCRASGPLPSESLL